MWNQLAHLLVRYTNKWEGNTNERTTKNEKAIIFGSFLQNWQQDYELSRRNYNDQSEKTWLNILEAKNYQRQQ